jgi:hypothetical protein
VREHRALAPLGELAAAALALALLATTPAAAVAARSADPDLANVDSHLQELVEREAAGRAVVGPGRRDGLRVTRGERVRVDVYVNGPVGEAAARLRDAGMDVDASVADGPSGLGIVEGWIPVDALAGAARLGRVQAIMPVVGFELDSGSVTSEGDAAHNGPAARALGVTGEGVPVGIMSDSINRVPPFVAGSQASGDLPPTVQVLAEPGSGSDEGRAMAEIVFDTAPGVPRILFATADGGPATKAANIALLAANGAKVIADDTTYISEPFFQDGVVSQAVDAARAQDVAYFASAGNRGRQSYESDYRAGTGDLHDFDPGAGEDTRQTLVSVPNNASISIFLQWDEPVGSVVTDLDARLANTGGTTLGTPGTSNNLTSGLPVEIAQFTNTTGAAVTATLEIDRFAGTETPFMKYIATPFFAGFAPQFGTASNTINPDAAAATGSLAVAAIDHLDPGLNTPEAFSSRGPLTRLFDTDGDALATPEVRQKPNVAAADGVSTTVSGFTTFFGTSAATPSAAGVAALLRSADSTMTADDVAATLQMPANVIDCTLAGQPDLDCGTGFLLADRAVDLVLPPIITPAVNPPAPDGAAGFYHSNVTVSFSAVDAATPVTSTQGCGTTVVSTDGVVPLTCSATSAAGTSSRTVTISRDATPPAPPAFEGIAAGNVARSRLPDESELSCTSTDATSGIAGCSVTGFETSLGQHTLTATADDNSGLRSTSTLDYAVVRALARVAAATRVSFARLARRGLPFRFDVGMDRTRVAIRLIFDTPGGARAARRTVVGKASRRLRAGRRTVTVKLGRRGRRVLRGRRRTELQVRIAARPPGSGPATTSRRKLVVAG